MRARLARTVRGWSVALLAGVLSAALHASAGGSFPAPAVVLLAVLLAGLFSTLLVGRAPSIPRMAAAVTAILRLHGCETQTAATAAECIRITGEWPTDVLICDVGLPDDDGYGLLRRLRGLPEGEAQAVIGDERGLDQLGQRVPHSVDTRVHPPAFLIRLCFEGCKRSAARKVQSASQNSRSLAVLALAMTARREFCERHSVRRAPGPLRL